MRKLVDRYWWIALCPSGKISEIKEATGVIGSPPPMLPPCSSTDLPSWVLVQAIQVLNKGDVNGQEKEADKENLAMGLPGAVDSDSGNPVQDELRGAPAMPSSNAGVLPGSVTSKAVCKFCGVSTQSPGSRGEPIPICGPCGVEHVSRPDKSKGGQ